MPTSSFAAKTRTCPLGHECGSCFWQVEVVRQHRTTGEVDKFQSCAIVELVTQMDRSWQQQDRTADAINVFRNEMVKGNDRFLGMLAQARLDHDQG